MRTENRSMPVYALVVARGGPKLKQSNLSHCIFDTAQMAAIPSSSASAIR